MSHPVIEIASAVTVAVALAVGAAVVLPRPKPEPPPEPPTVQRAEPMEQQEVDRQRVKQITADVKQAQKEIDEIKQALKKKAEAEAEKRGNGT